MMFDQAASTIQQVDLSWVAPTITALAAFVPAAVAATISFLTWRDAHRRALEDEARHRRYDRDTADLKATVQHVSNVATVTAAAVNALPGGSDVAVVAGNNEAT